MASRPIRLRCRGFCARPGSAIKKTLLAKERARSDVAKARNTWIDRRQPIMRAMPHRLVFIDETSTNTKLTRLRGRAPKGERLPGAAPFGHWQSQTFIAALRCNGLTAPWLVDGALDRAALDLYIETQLAPTLQAGEVVMLDNLKVHASAKAADVLKARGAWFLFLPANSPDQIGTPACPDVAGRRGGHARQPQGPRVRQGRRCAQGPRRLVPVPARQLARSQSDRDGVRQAESPSTRHRCPNL